jgi:predicted nucleic acid-binding protein
MRYLLDTNIVIAVPNGRSTAATARLAVERTYAFASAIVLHELAFGAYKGNRAIENLRPDPQVRT